MTTNARRDVRDLKKGDVIEVDGKWFSVMGRTRSGSIRVTGWLDEVESEITTDQLDASEWSNLSRFGN